MNYTNQLADENKIKREGDATLGIVGIDKAKKDYAWNLALTAQARDVDEANARYSEITSLLVPTKSYLDDRAQLDHDRVIEMAQHAADLAANIAAGMDSLDAQAQYDIEMATTAAWYASATASDDAIYENLDALSLSTWYARLATDEHTATAAWINAEVQHIDADAASEDSYAHTADALLVGISDTRDSLANSYNEQEAASWVTALAALNTAHPSPWASYELAKLSHFRDDYLTSADAAQATLDHETALADELEKDTAADDQQQSQDDSADDWSTEEQTADNTAYASMAANAVAVGAQDATHLPALAAIPSVPKDSLPNLGWSLNIGGLTGLGSSQLGTTVPNPQSDAQKVVQHLSDGPADAGAPANLVKPPEAAAAESSVPPAESSEASLGMKTALAAIHFINSTSDREREAIEKWCAIQEHDLTISDAGSFVLGMKEGFQQGLQDGLLGLAWSAVKLPFKAASFMFQINPITRAASKAILGRDIGADEQAALDKFEAATRQAIQDSPLVAVKLLVLKNEVEEFLGTEGAPLIVAMLNRNDAYFESRIEHLSPLAIEVLTTARIILVELAHAGLDTLNARSFGNIVGQVLYEVVEDAAVAAIVGVVVVGSGGTASPVAGAVGGAEVASKTARAVRIVERLSKIPGFNMPVIVKGIERVQEVIQWMRKYPIYGKAFDAFAQAKRAGLDDADALVYARKHIDDLKDFDVAEKARELENIDRLLGKPDGWGPVINATPDDYIRPKPNTLYHANGYFYRTDAEGHLVEAAGDLRLSAAQRNAYRQRQVGASSGIPGDEGGHMIGTQFGGLGEGPLQLVAQTMQLNRGAGSGWTALERAWADALDEGHSVSVRIKLEWSPGAKRPDGFRVTYEIRDGKTGLKKSATEFFENQ